MLTDEQMEEYVDLVDQMQECANKYKIPFLFSSVPMVVCNDCEEPHPAKAGIVLHGGSYAEQNYLLSKLLTEMAERQKDKLEIDGEVIDALQTYMGGVVRAVEVSDDGGLIVTFPHRVPMQVRNYKQYIELLEQEVFAQWDFYAKGSPSLGLNKPKNLRDVALMCAHNYGKELFHTMGGEWLAEHKAAVQVLRDGQLKAIRMMLTDKISGALGTDALPDFLGGYLSALGGADKDEEQSNLDALLHETGVE